MIVLTTGRDALARLMTIDSGLQHLAPRQVQDEAGEGDDARPRAQPWRRLHPPRLGDEDVERHPPRRDDPLFR